MTGPYYLYINLEFRKIQEKLIVLIIQQKQRLPISEAISRKPNRRVDIIANFG